MIERNTNPYETPHFYNVWKKTELQILTSGLVEAANQLRATLRTQGYPDDLTRKIENLHSEALALALTVKHAWGDLNYPVPREGLAGYLQMTTSRPDDNSPVYLCKYCGEGISRFGREETLAALLGHKLMRHYSEVLEESEREWAKYASAT